MSASLKPSAGTNITGEARLFFQLALNAATGPTLVEGRGASVSRSSTGVTLITLDALPNGKEFKGMLVTLCKATGTTIRAEAGGYVSATGVATVLTQATSNGTLVDPPAAAPTNLLFVELVFGSPTE